MAAKNLIEKIVRNWEVFYIPSSDEYVDKESAQSVGWKKTFTTEPAMPAKSSAADPSKTTAPATEAQVALKQDALTAWDNITITTVGGVLTISADNTTYNEVTKSAIDTWTDTTAGIVSAKTIADYVNSRVGSAVNYQGQVADYASLPVNPAKWDMYNVLAAHSTAPKFDAWTNVVWDGTGWDPMAPMIDLSNLVDKTSDQTIGWTKTFTTSPVVPAKSTDAAAANDTAIATEAQVAKKADSSSIGNATISFKSWKISTAVGSCTANQSQNGTITIPGEVYYTQNEYNNESSWKTTDNNSYIIYKVVWS